MAYVNIPRERDDPNYRYKMPRLISKVEGRGNGIKTNIANMGEIAKALKRPPMYPTKFFGCELGAMAKFEDAEEKAIINGAHLEKDLLLILDKFIEMYVLCPGCHLPEFDISVRKGTLSFRCNACGHQGELDMAHKAATYMIRNPPDQSSSTLGKKKKTKEERRAEKSMRRQKNPIGDSEEEEELEKEKEKEKKRKDKKEKKLKKDKEKTKRSKEMNEDDDEYPEGSDQDLSPEGSSLGDVTPDQPNGEETSPEKKPKKVAADELLFHEELHYESPEIADVAARLSAFLQESEKVGVDAFFQEVRMLQVSQDFNRKCRLYIVLMSLFGDSLTPDGLESKMPFVKKMVDASTPREDVFNAVQHFCYEKSPSTLSQYPYVIQKLYAAEVLESDDILKHYSRDIDSVSFMKCKKAVEPFLEWLRDNESEEDSDGEEETQKASGPTLPCNVKPLGCLQNGTSNGSNLDDMWITASTTPNTTKGADDEDVFHDAHESVEDDEEEDQGEDIDIDNI